MLPVSMSLICIGSPKYMWLYTTRRTTTKKELYRTVVICIIYINSLIKWWFIHVHLSMVSNNANKCYSHPKFTFWSQVFFSHLLLDVSFKRPTYYSHFLHLNAPTSGPEALHSIRSITLQDALPASLCFTLSHFALFPSLCPSYSFLQDFFSPLC